MPPASTTLADHIFYFFRIPVLVLNNIYQFSSEGFVNRIQGIDQRQGQFFFFQIIAGWLSGFFISIIKQIIFDLKCNTHCFAETA